MFDTVLRDRFEPPLSRAGEGLARRGWRPSVVTFLGVAAALAAAVSLAAGWFPLALGLLVASASADVLDGATARASGRVSSAGALWDAAGDRVADAALLSSLAVLGWRVGDPLLAGCGLAAVASAPLVSHLRARAEAAGVPPRVLSVGPGGRGERLAVLVAALVVASAALLFDEWAVALSALTASAGVVALLSLWSFGVRAVAAARHLGSLPPAGVRRARRRSRARARRRVLAEPRRWGPPRRRPPRHRP